MRCSFKRLDVRLVEAAKLGFRKAIIPRVRVISRSGGWEAELGYRKASNPRVGGWVGTRKTREAV